MTTSHLGIAPEHESPVHGYFPRHRAEDVVDETDEAADKAHREKRARRVIASAALIGVAGYGAVQLSVEPTPVVDREVPGQGRLDEEPVSTDPSHESPRIEDIISRATSD